MTACSMESSRAQTNALLAMANSFLRDRRKINRPNIVYILCDSVHVSNTAHTYGAFVSHKYDRFIRRAMRVPERGITTTFSPQGWLTMLCAEGQIAKQG